MRKQQINLPEVPSAPWKIEKVRKVYSDWKSDRLYIRQTFSPMFDVAFEVTVSILSLNGTEYFEFLVISDIRTTQIGAKTVERTWKVLYQGVKFPFFPTPISSQRMEEYLFGESDPIAKFAQFALVSKFFEILHANNTNFKRIALMAAEAAEKEYNHLLLSSHTVREKEKPAPIIETEQENRFHMYCARRILKDTFLQVRAEFKADGKSANYDKITTEVSSRLTNILKEEAPRLTKRQALIFAACFRLLTQKREKRIAKRKN